MFKPDLNLSESSFVHMVGCSWKIFMCNSLSVMHLSTVTGQYR